MTRFKVCMAIRSIFIIVIMLSSLAMITGCEKEILTIVGEKAPNISSADVYGSNVSLKQHKGKVVILFFWTNSCCGDKLNLLEPFYNKNKDKGVSVIGINENNSKEVVALYTKTNGITFTMLADETGRTAKEYGVFGFPTIFVIDKHGVLQKKILGDVNIAQLNQLVAELLIK